MEGEHLTVNNTWVRKTQTNGKKVDPKTGKKFWRIQVKPIKDQYKLREFIHCLEITGRPGPRNAMIFKFGVASGLRVSDILDLTNEEVLGHNKIWVTEQKTGKVRQIPLNFILADLNDYMDSRTDHSTWLFPNSRNPKEHVSKSTFAAALNRAAARCGLTDIVGTHTMRKTFGYQYYQQFHDLVKLMDIFGHSSEKITLRYIDVTQGEIAKDLQQFRPY